MAKNDVRQSTAFQPESHSNGMHCQKRTKQQDIAFIAMGNINNRNSTEHGMKFQQQQQQQNIL